MRSWRRAQVRLEESVGGVFFGGGGIGGEVYKEA